MVNVVNIIITISECVWSTYYLANDYTIINVSDKFSLYLLFVLCIISKLFLIVFYIFIVKTVPYVHMTYFKIYNHHNLTRFSDSIRYDPSFYTLLLAATLVSLTALFIGVYYRLASK